MTLTELAQYFHLRECQCQAMAAAYQQAKLNNDQMVFYMLLIWAKTMHEADELMEKLDTKIVKLSRGEP